MACGCCPGSFRREFRWRKCGLGCTRSSCFYCCQFKIPELVFIVYKAALAIYTLVWLSINIVEAPGSQTNGDQSPFVFLTTWSYILLNLHLYASLFDAIYMTYRHTKDGDLKSLGAPLGHPGGEKVLQGGTGNGTGSDLEHVEHEEHVYGMTWYHRVVWVLHDMITGAAPVVTIIYFAFLYPLAKDRDPEFASSWLDVNIHGINTVIMVIDNFVSAIPIRILHVIYPVIYGLIYVLFSLVYYATDPENHILYPDILDWSRPEITIPVIIIVVGVLMPLMQLLWYGWYRFRLWTFQAVYHRIYGEPDEL